MVEVSLKLEEELIRKWVMIFCLARSLLAQMMLYLILVEEWLMQVGLV